MLCFITKLNVSIFQILKPTNTLLNRLSRLLKLTTAEDVAFSLVLRRNSSKPEIVSVAKQHLKKRFLDLVQCYLDAGKDIFLSGDVFFYLQTL